MPGLARAASGAGTVTQGPGAACLSLRPSGVGVADAGAGGRALTEEPAAATSGGNVMSTAYGLHAGCRGHPSGLPHWDLCDPNLVPDATECQWARRALSRYGS
jgi:hypothetical protein